jgi:hypothetical protein
LESQSQKRQRLSSEIEVLQDGDLVFARVPSERFPWTKHNVFYNKIDKIASCDCEGFFKHRHCWHTKALLIRLGLEPLKQESPASYPEVLVPLPSGQS